jgi:hypothetical protein
VSVATRTSKFLLNDPTVRRTPKARSGLRLRGKNVFPSSCLIDAEPLGSDGSRPCVSLFGGRRGGGWPLRGAARGGRRPTTARQCPHNLLHKARSNPECRLTPEFDELFDEGEKLGKIRRFFRLKSCYWRRRSPQEIVGRLSVAKESTVDEFRKRKALIQQGLTLEILVCEMSWPLTASSRTPLIRR